MNIKQVENLFESFKQKKVFIVGDVMVDSYMLGSVDRISPEAPIPIVSIKKKENRLGGAANVALNIQSMGATPIICSVIGKDPMGHQFLERLKSRGISAEGIIISEHRPTTVKTRIISNNQQLIRVDEEVTSKLHEEIEQEFINNLKQLFDKEKPDVVVFQDYDKGVITPVLIEEIVEMAKEVSIPVLVDPKKNNFLHYKGVQLFKPNFKELNEGLKIDLAKDNFLGIFEACKGLLEKNKIESMLVTLSENGIFITDGKEYRTLPADIRDIADVSGAGDTVISVASLCLAGGIEALDIAAISNIAGGLVCEKVGVVPIDAKLLLAECQEAYS